MNARELLYGFFKGEKIDRLPQIEWASWWNLTLDRWYKEGLLSNLTNKSLHEHFGLDYHNQSWFRNGLYDCPKFKEHGFISDEEEYGKIRGNLFVKKHIYDLKDNLESIHKNYEETGDITWFTLNGFFWFPRELFGIEDHLYSFYDYPELYHRICSDMTEYYLFLIEEVTKHFNPQFMTFAEDMSYNNGPMVSEEQFDEFIAPYYRQIIPVLKKHNIKVIIDSDGDITKMVPWWVKTGVDGVLPLERQAGVDLNELTARYPEFIFIGGYDKMVMKFGEEAQRKEFERILPAIKRGNFIPSVDHQTPPDVSLENYYSYLKLLKEYCGKI